MLSAFVLHKERALLCAELLQVPVRRVPCRGGPDQRVWPLASQPPSPLRALLWGANSTGTSEEAQKKGWTLAFGFFPIPRSQAQNEGQEA